MGLGKTLQAIAIASYYRSEWPLLIITPSSLRVHWAEQIERWIPDVYGEDIKVIANGKSKPDAVVNIVSYDLLPRMTTVLSTVRFGVVIADESHFLKSSKSKRTQVICPILKATRRCVLLTGTPALSRPMELFTQLNAIEPNLFGRFHEFGVRYCAGFQGRFGWDFTGASNLTELHLLLGETLMIRRIKSEVLHELPDKRRQQVFLSVTEKHTKVMKKVIADLRAARRSLHAVDQGEAYAARSDQKLLLLEAFADTGALKLPAVAGYVLDMLEQDQCKLLVFAHHKVVIEGICRVLEKERKVDYIRIDGSTKSNCRQDLVDRFQSDPQCRVAVLSLTAAGCGLTLTAATCVIFAELYWNPGTLLQAEDRAHRMGQKSSVNIHYLLGRNTLDELLWEMIQHKLEVVGQTLNGEEEALDVASAVEMQEEERLETFDPFIDEVLENVANYDQRKQERNTRKNNLMQPTDSPIKSPRSTRTVSTFKRGATLQKRKAPLNQSRDRQETSTILDVGDSPRATKRKKTKWIDDEDDEDDEEGGGGDEGRFGWGAQIRKSERKENVKNESKEYEEEGEEEEGEGECNEEEENERKRGNKICIIEEDDDYDQEDNVAFNSSNHRSVPPCSTTMTTTALSTKQRFVSTPQSSGGGNGIAKLAAFRFQPSSSSSSASSSSSRLNL
eukprot:TRINITY_DN7727_c0_g1_i4.p1 TRINITY_DN7727_c0_g1~~TRINITY_DN7727_c0_g1_i4.p1  ORF type:complete len:674 (+),score=170.01 TRINITY_DN7727_c0_g1_i4:489-2510(+)